MKVCVFGAGAVGGHVAVRLASAGRSHGAEVSIVARGEHLAAIQANGLTLRNDVGDQWQACFAHATAQPGELPGQDLVLVALKAVSLPAQAKAIAGLLAPGGVAVFLNNGIPWWWQHGAGDKAQALLLLDPQGELWQTVQPGRALGGVVYSPNEVVSPGVVVHRKSTRNRFIFGTPRSANEQQRLRLQQLVDIFLASGLQAEASDDLCRDIWHKLLVNVAGNPVCALTRLTSGEREADDQLQALSLKVASEVAAVASAMGWHIPQQLIAEATSVGQSQSLRPSMLQDVLLGRPMEVEALLGQPQLFARSLGLATPTLDTLLPLLRGLDRSALVDTLKRN